MARAMDAYEAFHRQIATLHAPEIADAHLTLAQLKTLYLVAASGPIPMSTLAHRLGTAPSTTSEGVDRLVHLGLLERTPVPDDRRQVLVHATPEAVALLEGMSELGRGRVRELLLRLPTLTDIETVERAVRLLSDAALAMTHAMTEDAHP